MSNEEYELAFNILISLMYAYRLIFALIKHNDVMYDYIAEELFNIWDSDVLFLYRICNILITEIQDYEYNTIETNEFLKAALETLGKNQKAMHSEKIRAILESNTW